MDPKATLQAILSLIEEGDQDDNREVLVDGLRVLANWLETGGFFPPAIWKE